MNFKNQIIAVVENDEAVRRALERLLRASGYISETFDSAESYLRRWSCKAVDCLVLDINLDGISGIELQRKLLANSSAPPVIFISGRNDDATVSSAVKLGCIAYLNKPFESGALLQAIEVALDRSTPK